MNNDCFICHVRPGSLVALPKGVRLVCDRCLDKIPKSVLNEEGPERELFCPGCGMETTIGTFDVVECYPNPKTIDDLIGPYGAVPHFCERCIPTRKRLSPTGRAIEKR
jgi:hypothetical protein